jgi:hypothetical protein
MARKHMQGPPSVPAIVNGERCVYLTNTPRPSRINWLDRDAKPARELGENPPAAAKRKRKIVIL